MAYSPNSPVYSPNDYNPSYEDWCVTQLKISKFSYVWTITNFSACAQMRCSLESSHFPVNQDYKWCLRLNLNDRDIYYEIKLISLDSYGMHTKTAGEVKFRFLNSKGHKINLYQSQDSIHFLYGKENYSYRFTKDDLKKHKLLFENKLTIFAEVNIIANKINRTSQTYIAAFNNPGCKLIENYESILENGKFCDVTLIANDNEIKAHKAVLSARSIVFAAMFDHDMQENCINTVTITDISSKALKEMLKFIYTGKAPNIDQVALDLLGAADKYALSRLKSMCEVALYRTLSPETAAETLILADLHNAKKLKMETIKFIKIHKSLVEKTIGWQNLLKSHSNMLSSIGLYESINTSS